MKKDEILKIAQQNQDKIGEMERKKVSKANWIAIISTGILAVIFMFSEGFQGHRTVVQALGQLVSVS